MSYPIPQLDSSVLVAPSAIIVGDVSIKAQSVVLFHSVLRGDCGQKISIGMQTNIQDGAVVHVAAGFDTIVGNRVTIGHNAIIHGCTIDDECIIGMGATVMDGAHVPSHCIVGANALVTSSLTCEKGSLIIGVPARAVRPLNYKDLASIDASWRDYQKVGVELLAAGYLHKAGESETIQ